MPHGNKKRSKFGPFFLGKFGIKGSKHNIISDKNLGECCKNIPPMLLIILIYVKLEG